jgi:hypothetical protein
VRVRVSLHNTHDSELTTQTATSLDQSTMSKPISRSQQSINLGQWWFSLTNSLIAETQTMNNKWRDDCAL